MTPTLPTIRAGLLHLHASPDQPIVVGSAAWWRWLAADARSFRFEHRLGSFTARREQINGNVYWYAYRKVAGKLRKTYLGKTEHLTLDHMERAAATLQPSNRNDGRVAPPVAADHTMLTTKLHPPPARARRVQRQRLTDRLQAALQHPLTLVVAAAGSGKTTLVGEWAQTVTQPVAWVALDAGDNDPRRFWSYVLAALHAVVPAIAIDLPPHTSADAIVGSLAHQLTAANVEIVLVLDDYHAIAEPAIHAPIAGLLTHVLPNLHLVIISRTEPPLPLPRLRARGHLLELGPAELRFTPAEAATFLNEIMAAQVSDANVQLLTARTEGWITGLHLAALALKNQNGQVLPMWSGSHRYVLDYLADEVLLHQPAWVQTFLLRTSIVDRLSASLCDALLHDWTPTDRDPPCPPTIDAMLQWIERANLFLVPLDAERRWYRYHALFAEFLRARLQAIAPDLVPELHRRASAWHATHGLSGAAIDHAIAGGDWDRVIHLITAIAQPLILRGEVTTLLRWLDKLPTAAAHGNVRLNLLHAWALVIANQINDLDARLRDLQALLGAEAETALLGEVMALHSAQAAMRGDWREALAWALPALDQLPPTNMYRSVLGLIIGGAHEAQGNLPAAIQRYSEAAAAARAAGNPLVDAAASSSLAAMYTTQGRLRAAAAEYRAVLRRATDATGALLPTAGMAAIGLGDLQYQWNDLAAARASVEQGLALIERWSDPDLLTLAYTILARIRLAQGAAAEADDLLTAAAQLHARAQISWLGTFLQAERVHQWLHVGDLAPATRWAQQFEREVDPKLDALRGPEYLAVVRVHIAQAKPHAAQQWIDRLLPRAEADGNWSMVWELLVIQTLVAAGEGNMRRALQSLQRALTLAADERPIRVFVDAGPSIVPLLHKMRSTQRRRATTTIPPEYLDAVVTASRFTVDDETDSTPPRPVAGLIEPLSAREHEVLRLLAAGLGNRAIADRLVIAPATVKRHLLNIYRKLDVGSRVQALHRARALHLTP